MSISDELREIAQWMKRVTPYYMIGTPRAEQHEYSDRLLALAERLEGNALLPKDDMLLLGLACVVAAESKEKYVSDYRRLLPANYIEGAAHDASVFRGLQEKLKAIYWRDDTP